jgi:hypothetical protein
MLVHLVSQQSNQQSVFLLNIVVPTNLAGRCTFNDPCYKFIGHAKFIIIIIITKLVGRLEFERRSTTLIRGDCPAVFIPGEKISTTFPLSSNSDDFIDEELHFHDNVFLV